MSIEAMETALKAYDQAALDAFNSRFSGVFGAREEDCRKFREDLLNDPYRQNLIDLLVKAHEHQPNPIIMRECDISPEILAAIRKDRATP